MENITGIISSISHRGKWIGCLELVRTLIQPKRFAYAFFRMKSSGREVACSIAIEPGTLQIQARQKVYATDMRRSHPTCRARVQRGRGENMALSKNTKNHDEIRKWAESRGAVPSEVAATHTDSEPGILRFQFPRAVNKNDAALREVPWDEFFEKFDENGLALVYQDKTASGRKSNFNKLVKEENVKSSTRAKKKSASSSGRSAGTRARGRKSA
jgi:hypothetical protein